jgi:NADP-dependent 3-hydroxy acid dehydrogenase YdfG
MVLKDSVAIVTGASRGIGASIAIRFAREGVRVILAARNERGLKETQSTISTLGGVALAIPTDVTSESSVQHLVEKTVREYGRIDILVNNAGVGMFSSVIELETAHYDIMMDVNLKGVFLCCKHVLPIMMQQRRGDIVNIASLAGKNSFAGGAVYSATKWGVIGFSRSLMLEVRDHNIRVVTIAPGSVNTQFGSKERNDLNIIQSEDVAETVCFAVTMPDRVNVSEIDIRPSIKPT